MTTYADMETEEITLAGPVRPPDPEALGRIRNIVKTAHKWGGDGVKPKFTKIRQVLVSKHPEVIAKAFGGDPDKAAGWIKANWYKMRGRPIPGTRGKSVTASLALDLNYMEAPSEFWEEADELFCAANPSEEGGLVWTTALRTGTWQANPIPGSKGPLKIDKSFMDDVLTAWKEGAWEHVTVPTYHTDEDVLANTGFVRELKVVPDPKRDGEFLMRAGIEFTEPDVKERVMRGSIAGCSVNVKYNIAHQESGKRFSKVLTHIALTNIPFINGLDAFKQALAADREATPDDVEFSYVQEDDAPDMAALAAFGELPHELPLEDDEVPEADAEDLIDVEIAATKTETKTAKVGKLKEGDHFRTNSGHVFKHQGDHPLKETHIMATSTATGKLKGFPKHTIVRKVSGVSAAIDQEVKEVALKQHPLPGIRVRLTNDSSEGGATGMAEEKKEETTESEMTLTREDLDRIADERAEAKLQAFREEQEAKDREREQEMTAMRRELHVKSVKEQVDEMVKAGHAPAVVEKAKQIMLADERKAEVLSLTRKEGDEDVEVKLSATDIVKELLTAIPETALDRSNVDLPLSGRGEVDTTKDAKTRADELYDELYGNDVQAVTLTD